MPLNTQGRIGRFDGKINTSVFPDFEIATITAGPHECELTHTGVRQGAENPFFLNLVLAGDITVEQSASPEKLSRGDLYVLDTAMPFKVHFGSGFKILCVTVREQVMRPRVAERGRLQRAVIRGQEGAGLLLAHYVRGLHAMGQVSSADTLDLAAQQLGALIVNAASGSAAGDSRRDQTALHRIIDYLEVHLRDESLDVQTTCKALGMSRTQLYDVLAASGKTFWAYVRNRRLDECKRALSRDPGRTVAEVCTLWGFTDQSSFTRMFRKRFGLTPGQVRREHQAIKSGAKQ